QDAGTISISRRATAWRVPKQSTPDRLGGRRHEKSILPVQPNQLALNPDPVRRQDADFVGRVSGLQRDRGAAAAETLQRGFLLVDQGHYDIAGVGALVALDQRHVAV